MKARAELHLDLLLGRELVEPAPSRVEVAEHQLALDRSSQADLLESVQRIEARFPKAEKVLAQIERERVEPISGADRDRERTWVEGGVRFLTEGLLRPMLSIVAEHAVTETFPEAISRRERKRDALHRWPNELAALAALVATPKRREKSQHERFVRMVQVGPTTIGKQIDVSPDPHMEVVAHVVAEMRALDAEGWSWLELAYVAIDQTRQIVKRGKATTEVEANQKLREGDTVVGVRESVSGHDLARGIREGTASVPAWCSLSAGPHVTTGLLVADRVGLVPTTGDPDLEAIGSKVADRIKSVRREFRARLGSQELTETKPRWVCPKGGAA